MAAGERWLGRRSQSLVHVCTHPPVVDAQDSERDARVVQPAPMSPRCREADRAGVARITAFLERNGSADAPILERAALNVTRRHCLYDWDRGLANHQWLSRWLSETR